MEAALLKGKHLLLHSGCGDRHKSFSRVMFLLTDGIPNVGRGLPPLYQLAESVRSHNIQIIGIAIGEFADIGILSRITGARERVFHVDTFDELTKNNELIRRLTDPLCEDRGQTVTPTTTTTTTPTTSTKTTTTSTTTTTTPTTTTSTTTTPTTTTTTTTTPTTTTTTTTPSTTTPTTTIPTTVQSTLVCKLAL